jgi:hypothetical protein
MQICCVMTIRQARSQVGIILLVAARCGRNANGRAMPGHLANRVVGSVRPGSNLGGLPGSAFDFRAIDTNILQRPIVEIRQLPHGGTIARPGAKRDNKRCNPHSSLPSVTKNRPRGRVVIWSCVECKRFESKSRPSPADAHGSYDPVQASHKKEAGVVRARKLVSYVLLTARGDVRRRRCAVAGSAAAHAAPLSASCCSGRRVPCLRSQRSAR